MVSLGHRKGIHQGVWEWMYDMDRIISYGLLSLSHEVCFSCFFLSPRQVCDGMFDFPTIKS